MLQTTPDRDKVDRTDQTEARIDQLAKWAERDNLTDEFSDDFLSDLGSKCLREFTIDVDSRRDWEETVKKAEDRFDMKVDQKNYPFEKSSNVKYPLLVVAVLQFAARAYAAIIPSRNVVKGKVLGRDPEGQKRERAERIGEHMSYQLLDEMEDWEEETDIIAHQIPIAGCAFRKCFRDPTRETPASEMVCARDLVVNNASKSLATVPRVTQKIELYPHEIEDRIQSQVFRSFDYGGGDEGGEDEDAPHEFIEQHRFVDLDEDGVREPWIITIHTKSKTVVRIVANFEPEDIRTHMKDTGAIVIARIERRVQYVKYPFLRDPKGGFYDVGFGKLLETLGDTIDSTLNQLMDAGHLQNAGGGFIGSGVRLKKSHIQVRPGKYEVVKGTGARLRDSIVNHEHPGPSQTLFQLLGLLIDAGERLASVQDITSEAMAPQMPATTVLALIEQGQKVYTAIYKRIYRALKKEFKILRGINAKHLPDETYFRLLDDEKAIARADYADEDLDVIPISDPNMTTDTQMLARAQVILEASQNPQWASFHNQFEAAQRFYRAASIEDVDSLIQEPQVDEQKQAKVAELEERAAEAEVAKIEGEAAGEQAGAQAKAAEIEGKAGERELKEAEMDIKRADVEEKQRASGIQAAELELKKEEIRLKSRELDLKERQLEVDAGAKLGKMETDQAKVEVERTKAEAA